MPRTFHAISIGLAVAALAAATPALAQVDPASGIDFVTVGAAGNAAYPGNGTPNDQATGRGAVDYEYRIGKYEVTSAQWAEFFSAAYDRPQEDWIPHLSIPVFWGGIETTPNTPGGRRWITSPHTAMLPTGTLTWRTAAIYCNWLHNNKSTNREAFLNGAYDVSTFGYQGAMFTDQSTRTPGASYFIPTWDEWLKASHYDPNKQNSDGTLGGWWSFSNSSDTPNIPGPPPSMGGLGTANFGWSNDGQEFAVPLGAYSTVTSPWGMFDTGGATTEFTEEIITLSDGLNFRLNDGTNWVQSGVNADRIRSAKGAESPSIPLLGFGFRVASVVPAPGSLVIVLGLAVWTCGRKRGGRYVESNARNVHCHGCSIGVSRECPTRDKGNRSRWS